MKSIYNDMHEHQLVLGHFESDLYVRDTPTARAILIHHGCDDWRPFHDPRDHRALCVPFAYDPWWQRAKAADRVRQEPEDPEHFRVTGIWEDEPGEQYLVRTGLPCRLYEVSFTENCETCVHTLEPGFNLDGYLSEYEPPAVQLYDCPDWVREGVDTIRSFCVN